MAYSTRMSKIKFDKYIKWNQQLVDALDNADLDFIKLNLDITDSFFLSQVITQRKTEIFKYVFPLYPQSAQETALKVIVASGCIDYLDFALQYVQIDINECIFYEKACSSGNIEMVRKLEEWKCRKSDCAFSSALSSSNLEVIEYVYAGEKISPYFTNQTHVVELPVLKFILSKEQLSQDIQRRILLGAAGAGLIEIIDYLLKQEEPPSSEGALFETVYFGAQLETLKYLLTKAPVISCIEEEDYAAFIWAYEKEYEHIVDYLVNEHNMGPGTHGDILEVMLRDDLTLYERVKRVV